MPQSEWVSFFSSSFQFAAETLENHVSLEQWTGITEKWPRNDKNSETDTHSLRFCRVFFSFLSFFEEKIYIIFPFSIEWNMIWSRYATPRNSQRKHCPSVNCSIVFSVQTQAHVSAARNGLFFYQHFGRDLNANKIYKNQKWIIVMLQAKTSGYYSIPMGTTNRMSCLSSELWEWAFKQKWW